MAVRIEQREVEVVKCDLDGKEVRGPCKCSVCYRDVCQEHTAYALEDVFRYRDRSRGSVLRVCVICAAGRQAGTIGELLDGMLEGRAVNMALEHD